MDSFGTDGSQPFSVDHILKFVKLLLNLSRFLYCRRAVRASASQLVTKDQYPTYRSR
ncbi:MAG: hypothetical protein LKE40_06360 [Spirochaetia bacterium]|nr:hypothetical protein [Spirochaetia bacterium]